MTEKQTVGATPAFPGSLGPPGMTYRQWLIGRAVEGLLASPGIYETLMEVVQGTGKTLANYAIRVADAVIEKLDAEKKA